jgi:hypothetical protein
LTEHHFWLITPPTYRTVTLFVTRRRTAGQAHLNLEKPEQIDMVSAGIELFSPDAAFFGFLSFENIQDQST